MKGSVLGHRFEYTLHQPDGRTDWDSYVTRHREMVDWCSEQTFSRWGVEGNTFWFFYERDYMLFMLRWS